MLEGNVTGDRTKREVSTTVNGETVTTEVDPRYKLADFLRYEAGCTGVRVGCEHGVCGACMIEMDGELVKSCLLYAVQADGSDIQTHEGLVEDGELHPIQQSFSDNHALQCGFCTSGFVMATKALLEDNPDPDREEIVDGLSDNLCRCTGYRNIVDAVEDAAERMSTD
jgi:carbon-monoxide dehydrogenase small subunit